MTSTNPQKEKERVPWCIPFSGKDLLKAAWGSKKGADLLYHLLHKASWEKKNKHENETLKDIKFQESTPKALEKSGLSLGCFHTYLKHFVSVGYVSTEAYSGEYIVHIEAIQQAFSNTPEKPVSETGKRRQARSESFNLKDCNFVTLSREDYEMLVAMKDECFNLKEMFQSLKHSYAQTLAEMKEMFQSLKQNPTIYAAQEANLGAFSDLQSNDLRDSDRSDLESKKEESANAPHAPSFTQEEIAMIVRSRLPEGDAILLEHLGDGNNHRIYRKSGRPLGELIPVGVDVSEGLLELITVDSSIAYSQVTPQPEQQEEKDVSPAPGYTNDQSGVNPPVKPAKGNKRRQHKTEVKQPLLVDTNRGVAFNEEEQCVFEWYCAESFVRVAPPQDELRKKHCGTLVPHVHSQEEMHSLAEFTKERLKSRNINVYVVELGNMTNSSNLNAWLAKQHPTNVIDFQQKTSQARPGSWREHYENDPNNGGYNDEASFAAWLKTEEEITNAAI